jgi:putative endopeptidase
MRIAVVCLVVGSVGCSGHHTTSQEPTPHASSAALAATGIVPAWIDRKADPCTDFFAYACGGFVKTAQIPADRSSWGAIQIVSKDNEEFLRGVLEDAAKKPGDRLGDYYAACMDEDAIEKAGAAPLVALLKEVEHVTPDQISMLHARGLTPFFNIGPQQDFADATKVIMAFDQSGLGLPDRKYYLEDTGTIPKTREAYRAHMERMFTLLGVNDPKQLAKGAYEVELQLAKAQQDEVTRRDPHAVYHRIGIEGLEKIAPSFPWRQYLKTIGVADGTAITVNDPAYYKVVADLLAKGPRDAVENYVAWTVMREMAHDLSKAWVDEAFTMEKELTGIKELPPRWRRCVERVDADLGELLGQSYVAERFAGDSKSRAVDLTKAVLANMRGELDVLPWMDDATRAAAKQKLGKMAYLVGYPDKWRSYEFEISRTDFAKNVFAATQFEVRRQLGKIGKPVDRFDWQMTPPTVNAYYDPTLNEIALPAGQLQAPFFGATFHPAVNFGSTGGGTIGHEMTHGFDDEGSQFDANGNLADWWTAATKANFKQATQCVVDQYSRYEAVPGVHLDGKLTAGENIADNGGVKLGYEAYKAWRSSASPPPAREVDGFTDDQLYFLAYGQSWCEKLTPELLETMAHSNPHSPPQFRVNGVIVNQPGFAPAFSCRAGTPMNPGPTKQCSVW